MLASLPFGGPFSLAVMGMNAASQTAYDAVERGASAGEAFTSGLIMGTIEALTEKIPLDNLFKIAKMPKRLEECN